MSSIHSNGFSRQAISTLRSIDWGLDRTQQAASSGLRVGGSDDNAAYWSISTTMRSDRKAISAVSDALGFAAAKADVAYTALSAVIDTLSEFKTKMVASLEAGVDRAKIQRELDQLKQVVVSTAQSASFGGINWLDTDIPEVYTDASLKTSVVSSFVRDSAGGVSVKTMDFHPAVLSLFNRDGGGLLQADPRFLGTIGGIRYSYGTDDYGEVQMSTGTGSNGYHAYFQFDATGPLTFDDPADVLSFDVTVDADDPSTGISPAFNPGQTTSVVIDRSTVDAALPGANGVIANYDAYIAVLNQALSGSGAAAGRVWKWVDNVVEVVPNRIEIFSQESSGLDGSSIEVSGLASNVGTAGFKNAADFGSRGSSMTIAFQPFTVYESVEVSLSFDVNQGTATSYVFDRDYINATLGKTDGKVATADEMVTLIETLIGNDWPDVLISAASSNRISIRSDPSVDRLSGGKTSIGFSGISVNIEPLSGMNFLDIDIAESPGLTRSFIRYIDNVQQNIMDGAALLGALQSRIEMQSQQAVTLMDVVTSGIGRLVDADMNETATRLKALQTQQQLGIQSLQIANASNAGIMQLFQ